MNPELEPYGFKTLPDNWEGKTSFIGLKKMIRRWDSVNSDDMKKELIESLPPEMKGRERFS